MPDVEALVHFPVGGLDVSCPFGDQTARPLGDEKDDRGNPVYCRTTPVAKNVRAYESTQFRRRGGTRPGLERWIAQRVGGNLFVVQELATVALFDTSGLL